MRIEFLCSSLLPLKLPSDGIILPDMGHILGSFESASSKQGSHGFGIDGG